jgi:hypothetical protein
MNVRGLSAALFPNSGALGRTTSCSSQSKANDIREVLHSDIQKIWEQLRKHFTQSSRKLTENRHNHLEITILKNGKTSSV